MSPNVKPFSSNLPGIGEYVEGLLSPEDTILANIRTLATTEGLPNIHISRMDICHLTVLVKTLQAKKIVEIGSLCGYSAVVFARAMGPGGHLWSLEKFVKNAELTKHSLNAAGLLDNVTVVQGEAANTLSRIEHFGPFDMIFLDADKQNYMHYLQWSLEHIRIGGLIVSDNAFAWGLVLDDSFGSREAQREGESTKIFNATIAQHPQLNTTFLPTSEGMSVSVRIA